VGGISSPVENDPQAGPSGNTALTGAVSYEERGRYFGNSAGAIEKKLRRLIEQQREPRRRIEVAKKALEAARRRDLMEPWPGTNSIAAKAESTEPDTNSRE
jgi:hypothetical protein